MSTVERYGEITRLTDDVLVEAHNGAATARTQARKPRSDRWMTSGRIVVGVDGSCEHLAPIEWAYREAGRREAALDLVHAWNLPLEISPSRRRPRASTRPASRPLRSIASSG